MSQPGPLPMFDPKGTAAKRKPVLFKHDDAKNLELVRQIVLCRLKEDKTFDMFDYEWAEEAWVRFEDNSLRQRFVTLATEVMWQLVIQGVISPGLGYRNPNFPFFHITDYGAQVLDTQRFIPHDPVGYLAELRSKAQTAVTSTALSYVEEALRCFNAGCYVASVLLLGVAAESILLRLWDAMVPSKPIARKPRFIKEKHQCILQAYENLPKADKDKLPESLDPALKYLYDLIRQQRNELGHPQATPPSLQREDAFMWFTVFPAYVAAVDAFVNYLGVP